MKQIEALQNLKIKSLSSAGQNQGKTAKYSTTAMGHEEKFIKDTLASTKQYFKKEKNILPESIQTLQEQQEGITRLLQRNLKSKQEIDGQLLKAQQEQQLLKEFEKPQDERTLLAQIQEFKGQLINLNKMRIQEANAININILKSMSIKNKDKESPVNELWIWVVVIIYKEPAASYYWNNFKSEVLENTQGAEDFKERMARVKAIDLKKDEIERTQKVLRQKEIIYDEPIVTAQLRPQLDIIFKIITLMLEIEEMGNKIRAHEKLLQLSDIQKIQAVKNLDKNTEKLKILTEGAEFFNALDQRYRQMHRIIQQKIEGYEKGPQMSEKFLSQIEKNFTNLTSQGAAYKQEEQEQVTPIWKREDNLPQSRQKDNQLIQYQKIDTSFPEIEQELEPEKAQFISSKNDIQPSKGTCQIY